MTGGTGQPGGTGPWLALVESNTTGTGRQFCAAARQRGLRPVVLAARPERYPYLELDGVEYEQLDTDDPDRVLAACRQRSAGSGPGLAGVTSSSEYFVATAARAARRLALSAPDPHTLLRCRDKRRQRQLLATAGVAVPGFHVARRAAAAVHAACGLGFPVVVKPVSGSGSVGVRLCPDAESVHEHSTDLLGRGVDERGRPVPRAVLVEEYVPGPEYSVETFDGRPIAVVAKQLGPHPHFVETGHVVPAPISCGVTEHLAGTARRALAALGLAWGAAHTELRLGRTGPVVIEVNPRLAGGMIPTLVQLATGADLVDAVVGKAAGRTVRPRPVPVRHAAIQFAVASRPGTVVAVHGIEQARGRPGVTHAGALLPPGTPIEISHSFRDRFGYVVATGPDATTAVELARRAAGHLHVQTRPTRPEGT
ncbi:MAG: ATP-grasp domain-containing protein [Actinobacteria bacterium]|nr:ATP-grasp domain-containing protein [Actinomycetota bacterium]